MAAPINPSKHLRSRIAVNPPLLVVDITTPSFPPAVDALDLTSGKYVAGGQTPNLPVHPQTAKNHIQLGTIRFGKAPKWLIQSASGIPVEGQNRFTTYATTAFNQMYSITEIGSRAGVCGEPNFHENRGFVAPKDVEGALRLGEVAHIRSLGGIRDSITVKSSDNLQDLDTPRKQHDMLPHAYQQAFWAPKFRTVAPQFYRNA
ncbi:hypothetical protein LTR27_011614 [Elasticomyces elasticus]|nr:hypothetical protein LTR27_011614 [Elasticomyces elasticus]